MKGGSNLYQSVHPLGPIPFQELRGQEFQRDSLLSACKEVSVEGPGGLAMESQVRRVLMFNLLKCLSKKMGGPFLVGRSFLARACSIQVI